MKMGKLLAQQQVFDFCFLDDGIGYPELCFQSDTCSFAFLLPVDDIILSKRVFAVVIDAFANRFAGNTRKTDMTIYKLYNNHDWRATFGTQLKEANLSSAQVADLLGHADTRMVETVYAVTRHQGVMKHQNLLNALNPYSEEIINQPYKPANAQYISVLADAFAPSVLHLPKNG